MKKYLFISILTTWYTIVSAQHSIPISLNVYGGYTFQDRVDLGYYNSYNDYGYINAAGQYGAGVEFFVNPQRSIELRYMYMGTHAPFYDYLGQTNKRSDDANINYILIGGNNYFPTNSNILPYVGAGIGVGIASFNYTDDDKASLTKFAWDLRLGAKLKTRSVVSFKVQAYLQSIVQGVGVGIGFGTGGIGAGATTYSTMLQFGIGAGVGFALGDHK
ncbi:MAG: outer membrane beta-barrel protein [Chitinophagaceae bacterium]